MVLQLGVILAVAKIFGEITERFLRQPGVLGELVGGMAIGPYALGNVDLPLLGRLFPLEDMRPIPVSNELYALAQLAAVLLLFIAGLETDFQQFFRFGIRAGTVAVGGVVLPFAFGALATVAFGLVRDALAPEALFMGAIMTATSVGITARVLSDLGRLNTPEGVTILGAAVIDDVLGILVLAIVLAISGGDLSAGSILMVGARALGFWLVLLGVMVLIAGRFAVLVRWFHSSGSSLGLSLSLAFIGSALAQQFGLAMIIGAYSVGLALSRTDLGHALREPLQGVYHTLVPVFFVVMGMLVNFGAITQVIVFGLAISVLAVLGKVVGCGLPALAVGFSQMGALRVGIGMMPRGEVALIVAGVGIASGLINPALFGVSVMMTMVTTLLAPILLVPAFMAKAPGLRRGEAVISGRKE
jgi:Kef-type K+ transport system membrane component KefB